MISRSERVATSLTYIVVIDLCVLCVWSGSHSTYLPAKLYLRIHFTHQTGESHCFSSITMKKPGFTGLH
ncbi:hypothetical protein PN437_06095 [Microcystis aeruginosa CS-564/01]|uniref:hypothetical protein n=1 Tax=Microcystis aeruginosa TaxID=1126 RepID=UPI00232CC450|nr:hypothetical protein [Microcystis aeruginosa]MDB9424484.1 hypothetical protein [Microcystis aeruginosa CS-564/01]